MTWQERRNIGRDAVCQDVFGRIHNVGPSNPYPSNRNHRLSERIKVLSTCFSDIAPAAKAQRLEVA